MVRLTNNREVTHTFFYIRDNENYTFGTQCSFDTNNDDDKNIIANFYSYYTKVAMLYHSQKTNETYLLCHWNGMTPTTGKQLSRLRQANPYYKILYMPFQYGEHFTTLKDIIERCLDDIQTYTKENIITQGYFYAFIKYYSVLSNILEYLTDLTEEQQIIYNNATKLYNYIRSDEFFKAKKEAIIIKAAETRAKNKEEKARKEALINSFKPLSIEEVKQQLKTLSYQDEQLIKSAIYQPKMRDYYHTLNFKTLLTEYKVENDSSLRVILKEHIKSEYRKMYAAFTYKQLIKIYFIFRTQNKCYTQQEVLKELLLPNGTNALLTYDNNTNIARTTMGVNVALDDVKALLIAYKHNKLLGRTIKDNKTGSFYTVLSVNTDNIKIGCHIFPIQFINYLCEELQGA